LGEAPVFYDPTGRRRKLTLLAIATLITAILAAAIVLGVTLMRVPVPPPLQLSMEHPRPRPLAGQVGRIGHKVAAGIRSATRGWLPASPRGGPAAGGGTKRVTAFYAPWDESSRSSLGLHIRDIDWLVPDLASVTGPDHRLTLFLDPYLDGILAASPKKPKLLPMVQNAINSRWDGPGIAALLHDRAARSGLLDRLQPILEARKAAGVTFDFEALPASAQADYKTFLKEARARFAPRGWIVALAVPVDNREWNLADYGRIADRLFLMVYDEHWLGGEPGPIASQAWFVSRMQSALRSVPPAKATVAIASYAYNWTQGGTSDPLSVEEAWLASRDSSTAILFDKASGNPGFSYEDEEGTAHQVWMLDAATAWNEVAAASRAGAGDIALWRLGSEDPGIWEVFRHFRTGEPPHLAALASTTNVDIEGYGEILRVEQTPTEGERRMLVDRSGLVRDEQYLRLPSPYLVRRTGNRPGLIVLTFDDGPDPAFTPAILDVLAAKHAPGVFFVIGENAIAHPRLMRRIVEEGHEVGNHSYTHPNLALVSARGTRLELNATQRVIEAYTGRSTRLFRAPYFGDAEPTTADEIGPALAAQQAGYINIGLHVDPADWRRPGVDAIVERTLAQVASANPQRTGNIVLLHDAGGDRSQTLAALPILIDSLRARGYRIVPLSALAGLSPAQVMPPVRGSDLLAVRADVTIFLLWAVIDLALRWLFFAAILLGIGRAVLLTVLAMVNARVERRRALPPIDPERFVSVIIPAYNEAQVIESSIRRVLASSDVKLEVVVVDDGSADSTSRIVRDSFGDDPRVRLLTIANGGKANALNRGLALSKGELVVSLDADTQFEPDTIARLARWFDDPELGAVAGNAKVGNRTNLVTRWQAVEYVTAQNLERRALARFDAMTVVPGAVGAWRRSAIEEVGGYPADTLAEDQDLTIAIQRAGWSVGHDPDAVAWTEAPDTFRGLARQRFRWAFGTLQCLWKHSSILKERRPLGLALVGLPQAWLFQMAFALVSPVIDLALLVSCAGTALRVAQHGWAQTESDVLRMLVYWLAFTFIDLACGWVAFRLERRERRYPAFLLFAQRLVYRQIMYSVVVRAVHAAFSGPRVGWGKLDRTGTVSVEA
jgi:cellulose synthase/poly-beta-1,6-N-acetylglucosamine synthase-like glycosyltransferase/peptidoglycan/xylan/chitin deacetylase (PgdA/CDA1 family)/spore germination protein YaaH